MNVKITPFVVYIDMDKFVANCKTVCSFLFGRGVVSQYGKVYFDSPEVAKVLGNVEYKEVMLLERYFTRIIRYHTFVIRRRVNRKYEYILLCKVNEAEAVLVTPDYETVLKANEEYTSMVKILERLDGLASCCADSYEPVTYTWHFEPIVGGFRWKDSAGDVHMDGYPAIVGMLFAKYCKVL